MVVYKTVNLVNNNFYFGVHTTDNLEDGYLGSGTLLKCAIAKHGVDNFKRQIIKFHDNEMDAYLHEKKIVTEALVSNRRCYNIAIGGQGGYTIAGFSDYEKLKLRSKKSKSAKGINQGRNNGMYGKSLIEVYGAEVYKKFKINCSTAKLGERNGMYGIPPWEHPASTEATLKIWSDSDKYYTFWIKNKHIGHTLLAKSQGAERMNGPHGNLIRKFREGWIPWKDAKWLQWKRLQVEEIPTFVTSDLHLFHKNSIKFDNRPFSSIEDMHEGIIKRWNSTVPSYGITYLLGDVGQKKIGLSNIFDQLHGSIILISGNHDPSESYLYKMGITAVMNSAAVYVNHQRVELNHCPPRGAWREDTTGMRGSTGLENWHGENKHDRFTRDYGTKCFWLHGHCHKKPEERTLNNMFDVGGPANNYTPVSFGTIGDWITKAKRLGYGK